MQRQADRVWLMRILKSTKLMLQIVLNAVRKITNRLNRIKINSIRAKVVLKHTKTRPNPAIIIRDQITGKSLKISTVCSPLCSMIPQMVITMVRQAWPTSMSSRGTPALPTRPPTHLRPRHRPHTTSIHTLFSMRLRLKRFMTKVTLKVLGATVAVVNGPLCTTISHYPLKNHTERA